MSKRCGLTGKVFDTSPDDPHSETDTATDAIRQMHDHGQKDDLQNMSKRHSLTGKVFDTSPDDPQSKADAAADAVRKPHDLGQAYAL